MAPERAPLIVDAKRFGFGWQLPYFEWNIDTTHDFSNWLINGFRHPGQRANMLYMDGHSQPVKHFLDGGGVRNYQQLWAQNP